MSEGSLRVAPLARPLVGTVRLPGDKSIAHRAVMFNAAAEGEALIAELERHGTQAKYIYCHRWRDNDVLMWDNRCTVHCVTTYDAAKERRIVHRAVVQGDRPF